jgi:RNA polymerase sigma-70 factor, ECF subfamily
MRSRLNREEGWSEDSSAEDEASLAQDAGSSVEDEGSLIERARSDEGAFAELYGRYVHRVFRYLRTHTESEDDASDLTQHVFMQAFRALPGYENRKLPFSAWLIRIARNAAIDTYRRRRRVMPWDHVSEQIVSFGTPTPEEAAIRRERMNDVRLLVAQLSADEQELLALRFAAGLTSKEIGELRGRTEAAVQKQLVRIMRRLKEKCSG